MARAMIQYKMTFQDGVELFGKYVGNWGGKATVWRFDGIKDGIVVSSKKICPNTSLHLEVTASSKTLTEGDGYDMAAVRIRLLDENNNLVPYAPLPLRLTVSGAGELVGPGVAVTEGGSTGTYVRTTGKKGNITLTIENDYLDPVKVEFTVEKQN